MTYRSPRALVSLLTIQGEGAIREEHLAAEGTAGVFSDTRAACGTRLWGQPVQYEAGAVVHVTCARCVKTKAFKASIEVPAQVAS